MVGKVIRDYMEDGAKKLTVPGFGTFMRRDGGGDGKDRNTHNIIFVDLLRGDDKTLSEMVEDRGGYSELEAMALIDRFIFETRHAIERHGSATIEGFGTLTIDHKGMYQFRYSPSAKPTKETAVQEKLFEGREAGAHHTPVETTRGEESRIKSSNREPKPTEVRRRPNNSSPKRSRMDTILIVAIIAAVIALVALVFGMSSSGMPFLSK